MPINGGDSRICESENVQVPNARLTRIIETHCSRDQDHIGIAGADRPEVGPSIQSDDLDGHYVHPWTWAYFLGPEVGIKTYNQYPCVGIFELGTLRWTCGT